MIFSGRDDGVGGMDIPTRAWQIPILNFAKGAKFRMGHLQSCHRMVMQFSLGSQGADWFEGCGFAGGKQSGHQGRHAQY